MRTLLRTIFALSLSGLAQAEPSIEGVSDNILGPMQIVAKVGYATFYILGVFLILHGLSRYRLHRINPNEAPISHILVCLISGILLILLPALIQYSSGANILENFVPSMTAGNT